VLVKVTPSRSILACSAAAALNGTLIVTADLADTLLFLLLIIVLLSAIMV
jgi:hypothetical protein